MAFNPFDFFFPKKFLGIDIGTNSIKIVELSRIGHRRKLENYGELSASIFYDRPFRSFDKNTLLLSDEDVAKAIKGILNEARMKSRKAIFSIPDFSTFFTNFELPAMEKEELPQAVESEARRHIPVPLGEVTLDWQVVKTDFLNSQKKVKILLVAVPNEIINQYQKIAKLANLELSALEAEVFGLIRSLVDEEEKRPIAIIDIGAQSTTCNIVNKRTLERSYSFDMSSNELTKIISKSLNVDFQTAEKYKKQYGIKVQTVEEGATGNEIRQILVPLVDVICSEVEKILNNFYLEEKREIQKIILTGGLSFMPGLREYISQKFNKETEVVNPFSNLFYPPILEKYLEVMGPSYPIAVGMALRGFEY